MRAKCKLCGKLLVDPIGPEDSPILLIGEFPGYYEVTAGTPFQGPVGDVLKAELTRLSVDWRRLRLTNLWGHDRSKDADELDFHLGRLMKETQGRKGILMMGSEVSKVFVNKNATDISGVEVTSPLLPDVEVLMASVNPAVSTHGTVGEFRTDLTKFIRSVKRYL